MIVAIENVRIDGQWRTVEVVVNTLGLACRMGPKAARSKSSRSSAVFGNVRVKVKPLVTG